MLFKDEQAVREREEADENMRKLVEIEERKRVKEAKRKTRQRLEQAMRDASEELASCKLSVGHELLPVGGIDRLARFHTVRVDAHEMGLHFKRSGLRI